MHPQLDQVDFSRYKRHITKIEILGQKEQKILTSMLDKDLIDVVNQATSRVKNHHRIQTKMSM